jgi:GNAT superfamily N-acetyltransferase
MNEIQVRDARESDREAILAVTLTAYEEYGAVMPAEAWREYREGIVRTLGDVRSAAQQVVAEREGRVVGTALLYPAGTRVVRPDGGEVVFEWPEIRLLAVGPGERGRGVGRAIVRECIRRAREAGAGAITLHTTDFMSTAMAMYERMGFVRAPELDFRPDERVLVKGYRLGLEGRAFTR